MRKILFLFLIFLNSFIFAENRFNLSVKNAPEGSVRAFEVTRKTKTIGNIKSTTVEIIFENQTNKTLEADFEFSLEDGENVVGYSLDINGKMRKGVVVEKQKAREVFESEVRRGVDPGFVEKTVGNNFKTRVYPIFAHGIRKIEITFEKEMPLSEKNDVFLQTIGKDSYFYFSENVNLPKVEKENPKNILVLFDVSDSAKNRNIVKEIDFLKKYCEKIKNPKIKIQTFANDFIENKTFESANFSEIEAFLKKQKFDGATNFSLIDSISAKEKNCEILLFSDGIENWSENQLSSINNVKINTINSSKSANFANLKKLSNEHFGVFVNLNELDSQKAVEKIFENSIRVLSVEVDEKQISDVFPKIGSVVEASVSFAGILKKKSGKIKINLGRNGKIEKIIEKTVSAVDSTDSDLIARLWATKKINELEIDKKSNRKEIIETAKKFCVVTDETSLIVLDTAQQYANHGIEPPEELMEEYNRIVSQQNRFKQNDNSKDGIPKFVYEKFEEFKRWWNKTEKDFENDFKKLRKNKDLILEERTVAEPPVYAQPQVMREVDTAVYEDVQWAGSGFNPEGPASIEGQNPPVYTDMSNVIGKRSENKMLKFEQALAKEVLIKRENEKQSQADKITLKAWESSANYISVLKKTETQKMYEKYLELKKEYGTSPAFFIEVSDYFEEENLHFESMRILSNLAEMELENSDILRALGNKLVERKEYKLAIPVFEKLTKIRSEIPQFYRDLALTCNLAGENQKAIENLWFVASKNWDTRFNEIQQICLNDMNSIIARNSVKTNDIDKKLIKNFDEDIRIVLTWNTDNCDIDLWVTDPNGEKCYYGHKQTQIGGRMSRDFTQGYGPEEFCIKNAKKGAYKIEVNYYGTRQQKLLQPIIVQAEVYTNFGRKNQKKEVLTLQLEKVSGTFEVGTIEF